MTSPEPEGPAVLPAIVSALRSGAIAPALLGAHEASLEGLAGLRNPDASACRAGLHFKLRASSAKIPPPRSLRFLTITGCTPPIRRPSRSTLAWAACKWARAGEQSTRSPKGRCTPIL